ncbi:hypothetical protein NN561_011730 [Cricetulus griseus]
MASWSSALLGSGPVGPCKSHPKTHAGPRCPRRKLPPAGTQSGDPGYRGSAAAVLSAGSGKGLGTAASSRLPPPAPSGPRALPTPARSHPGRRLAPSEAPGCPLQTASHMHRPRVLSSAVAVRKSVPSPSLGKEGALLLTVLPEDPQGETKSNTTQETGHEVPISSETSHSHLLMLHLQMGSPGCPL